MIRINLLPVRASKKREFGRQQLVFLALILILVGIGNWYWYSKVDGELTQMDQKIASTRSDIAQLEKTIGEVKSIKEDKKALEDKLKILDTLKKGRSGPVRVMDDLASIIPAKVWIVDYAETAGAVAMQGRASSYEDLSAFSKKLKESKHFSNVTIKNARQAPDGTVDWNITCTADYSA